MEADLLLLFCDIALALEFSRFGFLNSDTWGTKKIPMDRRGKSGRLFPQSIIIS